MAGKSGDIAHPDIRLYVAMMEMKEADPQGWVARVIRVYQHVSRGSGDFKASEQGQVVAEPSSEGVGPVVPVQVLHKPTGSK